MVATDHAVLLPVDPPLPPAFITLIAFDFVHTSWLEYDLMGMMINIFIHVVYVKSGKRISKM